MRSYLACVFDEIFATVRSYFLRRKHSFSAPPLAILPRSYNVSCDCMEAPSSRLRDKALLCFFFYVRVSREVGEPRREKIFRSIIIAARCALVCVGEWFSCRYARGNVAIVLVKNRHLLFLALRATLDHFGKINFQFSDTHPRAFSRFSEPIGVARTLRVVLNIFRDHNTAHFRVKTNPPDDAQAGENFSQHFQHFHGKISCQSINNMAMCTLLTVFAAQSSFNITN